jgi:beta-ribofuranosylaminobenzene 5'-phosphate synthase
VHFLLENGAQGAGQSSWGPTVYGVVEGVENGRKLRDEVGKFMKEKGFRKNVYCTTVNNQGALITQT